MESAQKFIGYAFGAFLAVTGIVGVPLAVQSNNFTLGMLSSIALFAGIFILGWIARE